LERLEEAHWDATLFFSFFERIQEAFHRAQDGEKGEMLQGMSLVRDRFFPLFREEGLLLERLGLFFQSLGMDEEAACYFETAARFHVLPSQAFWIESFLDAHPPFGEILQIGKVEGSPEPFRRATFIPWGGSMEALGAFDSVFLFPPHLSAQNKKPALHREIEKQFSLDTMVYSDADIEGFFSALNSKTDPKQILHFFGELERKKNISREQLERIARRLGREISPQEDDRFFETLALCLKRHMKPGSVLYAFIPGIKAYEDARFFEEIVVDPFLECEEKQEARGIWVTVRKL
jgi:hypothetical protein